MNSVYYYLPFFFYNLSENLSVKLYMYDVTFERNQMGTGGFLDKGRVYYQVAVPTSQVVLFNFYGG